VRDDGKQNVCGVLVDAIDYDGATERIVAAARAGRGFSGSALAVHGLIEATRDDELRYRINHLDLVTPDGQPVRWALNLLFRSRLKDRVYGPTLMLRVCAAAARAGLPIFLYGSRAEVLDPLARNLVTSFPGLEVAGAEASKFRQVGGEEKKEIVDRIRASGARIAFVGLGCPRQEVFAYEFRDELSMPVLAVGAAFDYHAGLMKEPPAVLQRLGLQWAWRLAAEPRRLWRRYLSTNPRYVALVAAQAMHLWSPDARTLRSPTHELGYA
jgi:exopolysaccharide biosynthesis WecB/TagA/CpsF family protein